MKEKITILISDDNDEFAMNLLNYLQKEEDIEVIGRARDGKEACEMIKNKEPSQRFPILYINQLETSQLSQQPLHFPLDASKGTGRP